MLKFCPTCREDKPLTVEFFHRNSSRKDGFQHECKSCRADRARTDPRRKEVRATFEYKARASRDSTRYRVQPKGYLKNLLSPIRQKCRKRGIAFDITRDWLLRLYEDQAGVCALTGDPLTFIVGQGVVRTNCSVDRQDPTLGYTKGNIQLVCLWANVMKGSRTNGEFMEVCREILEESAKRTGIRCANEAIRKAEG